MQSGSSVPWQESGSAGADRTVGDDLIVVSNRQPYRHDYDEDGEVVVDEPLGGLTAGLDPVVQAVGGEWIAWGDGDADFDVADGNDCVGVPPEDPAYTLQRVNLSEAQVRGYYDGYANQVLWPLCHSLPGKMDYAESDWETYREVNDRFAEAVLDHAGADSTIWFQDYHFGLAPGIVREHRPDATIMQFWHTPWPAPDVFRCLPDHEHLLAGLLGNDLLGFHVPRYRANFLRCAEQLLDDAVVDWGAGRVHYENGTTTVESFPLGVDADDLRRRSESMDGEFWTEFRREHGIDADTQVALGVDRLDYTKGIPERLDALEHLWETSPEWRGDLTYVQKGGESRERIPAYQNLQDTVETRIAEINDRFGTDDWQPVVYTTEKYPRDQLCSIYRHSDLALVGPVRDGMNLVAQEYVAAQVENDGALVLSELAGADEQLGENALTINPYDTASFARSIEDALTMDQAERRHRMRLLRQQVSSADLSSWLDAVFDQAAKLQT